MTFLTRQEIFDIVAQHLLTQNEKSYDSVNGWCMYRGPNGTKCAVGVLIADEVYTEVIENEPSDMLFSAYRSILEDSRIDLDSQEIEWLLNDLQFIHDYNECEYWRDNLEDLADRIGLVFNMKGA